MEYANFMEALIAEDKQAQTIAGEMEIAMDSLVSQGLVEDSTELWKGLCSQAWAFHVEKQQG